MSVLKYLGFQGEVAYEDASLVIQVLHVDDFLTTTCDRASEAQQVFEQLIDEYLEECERLGRKPNRPFKGSFNVRMTPELHKKAAMAASSADTTLNAWVISAVQEKLHWQGAAKFPLDQTLSSIRIAATELWSEANAIMVKAAKSHVTTNMVGEMLVSTDQTRARNLQLIKRQFQPDVSGDPWSVTPLRLN